MDEQLKSNLTSSKHWSRLVYMVVLAICLQISSIIMSALVALQFLFALVTGNDNINLRRFGDALSRYIFQALQFLAYANEEKPFPFAPWPGSEMVETEVVNSAMSDTQAVDVQALNATDEDYDESSSAQDENKG